MRGLRGLRGLPLRRERPATRLGTLTLAGLLLLGCTGPVASGAHSRERASAATATGSPSPSPSPACDLLASPHPMKPLPSAGAAMPSGSTMARIQRRGRLIAGVDQNSYLWGYRDPGTGELMGFDIDLVHEIARALFGDPDRVEFRTLNSSQRLTAAADGTVDLVAHSVTITCERKRQVAFSADYFHDGQRVLVNRGSTTRSLADLAGHKVCAARETTSIAALTAARPKVVPVGVNDWTDCLVLLQLGRVDAVSTTEHILQGLQAQDPETRIVGPAFTFEPHGIITAKRNTDLVRFTNAVLDRLRTNGTWKRLYARWMGRFGPVPNPPTPRYRG